MRHNSTAEFQRCQFPPTQGHLTEKKDSHARTIHKPDCVPCIQNVKVSTECLWGSGSAASLFSVGASQGAGRRCHGDAAAEQRRGRRRRGEEEGRPAQEGEVCPAGQADQAGRPDRQSRSVPRAAVWWLGIHPYLTLFLGPIPILFFYFFSSRPGYTSLETRLCDSSESLV